MQKRRTHAGLLPLQKWRSKTGNMVTPGRCPNPSLPLQLSIQHCRSLVAPRALLRESEPAFMGHPEGECNLTASATQKMRGVEIGSARQILAQGWGNVNVKMLLFCDVADIEVDIEVQVSRGEMRYTTEVNVA